MTTTHRPQPTASIRAKATKAAVMDALWDLGDTEDFDYRAWSIYDSDRLEAIAQKIRRGYEYEAERAKLAKGVTT